MKIIYLVRIAVFFTCSFLFINKSLHAQQLAFPGAEGAGAYTTGGRGTVAQPTTVFEVTNLNDDNSPGSFRYAVTNNTPAAPYRTIVFRVSGTIHLNSPLSINRANTTIAGQTAPGDGICLADHPVSIGADNIILRYIRFRMGDRYQNLGMVDGSGNGDAFGALGRKNLIIDHCTMGWSNDEACTVYRGDSTTLQWNIMSEPLDYSYHFETGDTDFERHGYGGIWGGRKASLHHNLIAHLRGRAPRFDGSRNLPSSAAPVIGSENADFRNNVLYNWVDYNVNGGEGGNYNIVNNYYKWGPSTGTASTAGVNRRYMIINPYRQTSPALPYGKYYMTGNYVDSLPGIPSVNTQINWRGAAMNGGSLTDTTQSKVDVPFSIVASSITTQTALEAYELVLQSAGASLPRRDTLDQRIVNDVRNRTGRIIDVQGGYPHGTPYSQTVNAWPTLSSAPAPDDTDHDGMPDSWETANGSDPNNAADRQNVAPNGYTFLENYLNNITSNTTSPQAYFSGGLNAFTQFSAAPSAVQTITVTGLNLTGNVTITPPNGYEISADGGTTWYTSSNPLILVPVNGSVSTTTLSVRLNTSVEGTYNGNIVGSTQGVSNFSLAVTGSRTNAPVPATINVTWPLLTNNAPAISANTATATNQVLGSRLAGTSYNSAFGGVTGWQRSATTSFLPIGYDANSYVEYTITPVSGKSLMVSSISMEALGGGTGTARMAVYYSLNNFTSSAPAGSTSYNNATYAATTADPVVLLNTSTNPFTGQQVANITTNISVQPSQTLSLRVYVWITGSGDRYFASRNVAVNGITSDVALPLRLLDFSTARNNGNAKLLWNTQNEVNVKGFEIEKSTDGQNFVTAGFVDARNSVNGSYSFTDLNTGNGKNYYRIKMIDEDGNFSYSKVLTVDFISGDVLTVYPNPANDVLTITYPVVHAISSIKISTIGGKPVRKIDIRPGSSQMQINISSLPKGTYLIMLNTGKAEKTSRFIKQ